MWQIRILLTASLLIAGTFGSWANQTMSLVPGWNFVTCQVAAGGNISDPTFLSIPAGFPSDPNDPPTCLHHAVFLYWNNSGFNAYYYFNAADATTWLGETSNGGWYDPAGNPAPVTWTPGMGAIIYVPNSYSGTVTLLGSTPPATTWTVPPGYSLRGSPTPNTIHPGYAIPADIISGTPPNGTTIYVYNGIPFAPCAPPEPMLNPQAFYSYYYDSNQGGWVPVSPALQLGTLPNTQIYTAVWVAPLPSAVIEGNVYQGANCGATAGLPNWAVQAVSAGGTYYGISDANGHYAITVPPGTYTVSSYAPPAGWIQLCGGPYSVTATAGNFYLNNNFREKAPGLNAGLNLDLVSFFPYPLRTPCCGQNMTYMITYRNGNAARTHVIVTLQLPPVPVGFTFVSESAGSTPIQAGVIPGNKLTQTWNIGNLGPLASGTITFTVKLPSSGPACTGPISSTAKIYRNTFVLTGTSTLNQQITCSYDPNDMQVDPPGCGPQGDIPAGQPLTYLVKFQNTGNGPASLVVVSNALDATLDVSTLQVLGSSHPNVLQVQGNQLVWTFPSINLPPQSVDDLGSQGYIKYQVSPLASDPIGAMITNNAAIFFDLNSPIFTVITTNTTTADPVPVAAFSVTPAIGSGGQTNNFTYTGGSTGATYLWEFGPDAMPSTSTDQNPVGVVFASEGNQLVTLQVSLGGCTSDPAVQIVTVGVPILNAQVLDGQLVLSWSGGGYHLQERGDLQPGTSWTATADATVTQVDSDFTATLPLPGNTIFYRLSQVAP
jgi:uncharacterized repeat protein (TIGR01451 family)